MATLRRRRLRLHWIVGVVIIAAMASVLLVDGFVHPDVTGDAEGAAKKTEVTDDSVPEAIVDGGPVIDATSGVLRSASMPADAVALTFDDGPDPVWTPKILEVLKKHGVPSTFFVLGSQVAQHPELVRDMRAAGGEIGLHTFSHVDLATVGPDVVDQELARTQVALAGATGETSYLDRPPYSSGASSLTSRQLETITLLGTHGQLTVLSDIDSRDWAREGVGSIIANSLPPPGKGGIVLLHDAGGERSQTVEALDQLIPQLRSRGYHFTTVTGGMGLPPANRPAGEAEQQQGRLMLGAVAVATALTQLLEWLLLVGAALVLIRLVVVGFLAHRHKRLQANRWASRGEVTRPVSVIVPAYNERECIASTVRSLLAGDHPIEVIVVDDGSTDGTADIVRGLDLPGVRLIRQQNLGKPAALNTGIANARHDIIVMMDGDTVFEPSTVRELIQPFSDPRVGAVAGNAKIANRRTLVARLQHIEYVIGFNLDRRAYDLLRCMPTVPGAIGAFRRSALRQVGGLSNDTLAEDTDLTMAICASGWRVVYQETARAWTEAPETLRQLWLQRYRWSYGTVQSMWKHRRPSTADGFGGRFGRVALIQLALFQIVLPLLAPLIDIFLIYGLFFLDPVTTAAAWLAILFLQLVVGLYAFRLEREPLRPLLLMPLQQIVYRQLMYAVLIRSVATAVGGARLRWQKVNRNGVANASLAAGMAHAAQSAAYARAGVPVPSAPPAPPAPRVPAPRQVPVPPTAAPRLPPQRDGPAPVGRHTATAPPASPPPASQPQPTGSQLRPHGSQPLPHGLPPLPRGLPPLVPASRRTGPGADGGGPPPRPIDRRR